MKGPVERLTAGLPEPVRGIVDWLITIVGAILVVVAVKAWVANPYRIPTASMEPALHCARPTPGCRADRSDRILANRVVLHLRAPRRGEVLVFKTPPAALRQCGAGGTFVKRLVGLPGELVTERDGRIAIDGRALVEPYVRPADRDLRSGSWRVPPGHYFFMGDNRADSCDSRVWGSVPREAIVGPVVATYWPPARVRLW